MLSYEEYRDFQKEMKMDKWKIGGFTSSYHKTEDEAKEYIIKNIGDIEESGCYNYACVSPKVLGHSYHSMYIEKSDVLIFKWNIEKETFEPFIETDENKELYEIIFDYIRSF